MLRFLLIALIVAPLTGFSKEDLSQLNPLKARGFFVSENLKPGGLADFQVEMELQEGFFAYLERFRLKVSTPENMTVGELSISPIVEFDDTISKKRKKGVQTSATLKTQIEIPANISELEGVDLVLTYIACTKKFCLTPRKVKFRANLEKATIETADIASSSFIQKQIDQNLIYALALVFLFGLLTSLTPCVYPLIPITLAVLGTNEKRSKAQSFLVSLCYVLGIALTYAILGVVAAQSGQLFGSLIGHPIVIVSMSLIFFAMGLSLLGFFELQAPAFIRNRMANQKSQRGFIGAFLSGLLAGVIASPCVGPVLVGVLAYIAQTQNSGLGFILLFTFAMGFGVLFILLGTFSQLANKLPRSGAWMNTIKFILACCLFALSLFYAWPLIKPLIPQSSVEQKKSAIAWQAFSPERVKQAQQQQKPVIIDFYADWCAACVEMDQLTFSKKKIQELSKTFVMLKVDATSPFEELSTWQKTYDVYGLPTMILIDSKGQVRDDLTLTGFEEADLFEKRMNAVLKK